MALGSAPSSGDRAAHDPGVASRGRPQRVPPRWIVRTIWVGHRAVHRFTGGRRGLQTPKAGKWGTLRLVTTGRHSGKERSAILGYLEDGSNLFTLAMNGWDRAEPAWWLNLQAHPDVVVELRDGKRAVRARAAEGEERERLWTRFHAQREWGHVDELATRRPGGTAVVVFDPRPAGS